MSFAEVSLAGEGWGEGDAGTDGVPRYTTTLSRFAARVIPV